MLIKPFDASPENAETALTDEGKEAGEVQQ